VTNDPIVAASMAPASSSTPSPAHRLDVHVVLGGESPSNPPHPRAPTLSSTHTIVVVV
jgi:hypothetical protein